MRITASIPTIILLTFTEKIISTTFSPLKVSTSIFSEPPYIKLAAVGPSAADLAAIATCCLDIIGYSRLEALEKVYFRSQQSPVV